MTTSLLYPTAANVRHTLEGLKNIPSADALGNVHNPVMYSTFAEQVMEGIERHGITVTQSEFVTTYQHQQFFGALKLANPHGDKSWSPIIGLRASTNQTLPRSLVIGNRVTVCSNLCFSGDLGSAISTKQTTHLNSRMPAIIDGIFERVPEILERQVESIKAYKDVEVSQDKGTSVLGNIFRRGGLSPSQLGAAIQQWDEPKHKAHAENGWSLWRLQQSCTEAIKPSRTARECNPQLIAKRTAIQTRVLDEELYRLSVAML